MDFPALFAPYIKSVFVSLKMILLLSSPPEIALKLFTLKNDIFIKLLDYKKMNNEFPQLNIKQHFRRSFWLHLRFWFFNPHLFQRSILSAAFANLLISSFTGNVGDDICVRQYSRRNNHHSRCASVHSKLPTIKSQRVEALRQ